MLNWKRWTAAAAAVGVLVLGGLATAVSQEAEGPALDVDSLAAEMQLDEEGRAELEELGALMDRRRDARRRMMSLRTEMGDVMRSLHQRLSQEQTMELHRAMRRSMQRMMQEGAAMRGGMGPGGAMHPRGSGHHGHHGAAMGAPGAGGTAPRSGAMPGGGRSMHPECPWRSGGGTTARDTAS